MTTLNDLDIGGSHPWPTPVTGQTLGSALVAGSQTSVWSRGASLEKQDVLFGVGAWQAIGGQTAGTFGALRYFLKQLEELASNPDLQPAYIRWTATAQGGQYNVDDTHDGWYMIESFTPDYTHNVVSGFVTAKANVSLVAPATPSSLAASYAGGAMSSSYSATATPLISFPIGSTLQAPTASTRTGGEGAIPISVLALGGVNPAPFVRPGTSAALYTGGIRVYDTINTGSNAVPVAGGTFVNANWVQVYGVDHDWLGDCVVTNGLLLFLFQVGQAAAPKVYLWNTSLGTPTWQLIGELQYTDNAGNTGTLREVNLDRLSLQEARLRVLASTSAGNYAELRYKLNAGRYDAYADLWAKTQAATSQSALVWLANAAYATGFTNATSSTTFPSNLATTTVSGYAAAQGSASGSPIFGFLYQNTPTTAQGRMVSSTLFGVGDTVGPLAGSSKRYGIFAVPYSGAVVLATAQGIVAPLFAQWLYDRDVRWVRG